MTNPALTHTSGDAKVRNYTISCPFSFDEATSIEWGMSKIKADETFSTTPLVTKSLGSGINVTNAQEGRLSVALHPDDTVNLNGMYYQELCINRGAEVYTVASGKVLITKDLV